MKDNDKEKETPVITFERCLLEVFSGQRECLHQPNQKVELGQVILGELKNPVARALYSLKQTMGESIDRFNKSAPPKKPAAEEEQKRREYQGHQLENQYNCVLNLFWELVHCEYPETRDSSVAITMAQGWRVCISRQQVQFGGAIVLPAFLKKPFGG
ncbi:MAG: hypothetical protein QOG91_186 [Candidatus Parcubacteria bacterium]|jgi:hypothetical protein|nr:hypothetical protein [Candidatus Parcubacteria bacterium]